MPQINEFSWISISIILLFILFLSTLKFFYLELKSFREFKIKFLFQLNILI